MTSIKLGLGALAFVACCLSYAETYRVREGDTLSGISHKFHVSQRAILEANDLKNADALTIGFKVSIPSASTHTHKSSSSRGYKVRNGDNDWAIAHRLNISVHALHAENPEVNWASLQPGVHLTLPKTAATTSSEVHLASYEKPARSAAFYKVEEGDNDWSIASKLGISNKLLRSLNPDVRWTRIHPGQKLRVPGSSSSPSHHASRAIRTRDAVINSDKVVLRSGPGTGEDKVATVDAGTLARVLDRDSGWYKLRFPKGTVAWVRADYLNPVKHHHHIQYAVSHRRHHQTAQLATYHHRRTRSHHEETLALAEIGDDKVIKTAYAFRGTRYRTGGTSRSGGFDCSGFVSTVYRKNGVSLPRTSHEQSSVGRAVSKSSLSKGDLVFFKTNRGIRINHVGIYIGNGKFIHASSGGGHVQVSSLNEGYYNRRFAGGRRVASHKKAKAAASDE